MATVSAPIVTSAPSTSAAGSPEASSPLLAPIVAAAMGTPSWAEVVIAHRGL